MVIRIQLDPVIDEAFRKKAMEKFGYRKGAIKEAAVESINLWLSHEWKDFPKIEHPTSAIKGLLKSVTESSVDLQHLASSLFIKD